MNKLATFGLMKKEAWTPSYAYLEKLLEGQYNPLIHKVRSSNVPRFLDSITPEGYSTVYTPTELYAAGRAPVREYGAIPSDYPPSLKGRIGSSSTPNISPYSNRALEVDKTNISVAEGRRGLNDYYGTTGVITTPKRVLRNGDSIVLPSIPLAPEADLPKAVFKNIGENFQRYNKDYSGTPGYWRGLSLGEHPYITSTPIVSDGKITGYRLPRLTGKVIYSPAPSLGAKGKKLKSNYAIPVNRRTKAMIRRILKDKKDLPVYSGPYMSNMDRARRLVAPVTDSTIGWTLGSKPIQAAQTPIPAKKIISSIADDAGGWMSKLRRGLDGSGDALASVLRKTLRRH